MPDGKNETKRAKQRIRNQRAIEKRREDPEARAAWAAYMSEYRRRNSEKVNGAARKRYQLDPAKHAAYMREWRQRNLEHARARDRARYEKDKRENPARLHAGKTQSLGINLSLGEFQEMCDAQGGLCAVCGKPQHQRNGKKALDIDHCHKTGKVRALLCSSCNRGMGLFNDAPDMMEKAVQYLRHHQGSLSSPETV